MNIYIASDHAGFSLKRELIAYLESTDHAVKDFGATSFEESDDYPDFITPCAEAVAHESVVAQERSEEGGETLQETFGIIIGGSGQGEAMAANRITGARAALFYGGSHEIVRLAREHNNANIISLGARCMSVEEAKEAIDIFLQTPFTNEERHVRRIAKF